jgi:hypothetical protein
VLGYWRPKQDRAWAFNFGRDNGVPTADAPNSFLGFTPCCADEIIPDSNFGNSVKGENGLGLKDVREVFGCIASDEGADDSPHRSFKVFFHENNFEGIQFAQKGMSGPG